MMLGFFGSKAARGGLGGSLEFLPGLAGILAHDEPDGAGGSNDPRGIARRHGDGVEVEGWSIAEMNVPSGLEKR